MALQAAVAAGTTRGVGEIVQLPAEYLGRLIGKGGVTIKALEALTQCRVKVEHQDPQNPVKVLGVSIRNTADTRSAEQRERRCARIAELLAVEGLSLTAAAAQADEELAAQAEADREALRLREEQAAVRRVLLGSPGFAPADVRAALREACGDEDEAADLLWQGFRAPQELADDVTNCDQQEFQEAPREEFPSLIRSQPEPFKSEGFCLTDLRKNPWSRTSPIKASAAEDFPALPQAALPPRQPLATTSCRKAAVRRPLRNLVRY